MFIQIFFIFMATLAFTILFHSPIKTILPTAIIGAIAYTIYLLTEPSYEVIFAIFLSAFAVGLLGDIFSRVMKEPTTIFIIPGIMPLVPGSQLFHTMTSLIDGNFTATAETGLLTLAIAGSIALGLVVEGSVFHIFINIKKGIRKSKTSL